MTLAEIIRGGQEIENRWAARVGGEQLAPLRATIGFAISQLMTVGQAKADDLDAYFSECLAFIARCNQ